MDASRHHRSPPSERFLGLFSSPPGAPASAAAAGDPGVELHEDEIFWTGADADAGVDADDDNSAVPPGSSHRAGAAMLSPSAAASSSRGFRRVPEKNFGILAALQEEEKKQAVRNPSFLQRNPSAIPSVSSASTSPTSSSPSARMIPVIPKPKQVDYSMSVPGGRIHHLSAPVNVPLVPRRQRRGQEEEPDDDSADNDEERLPPHEMVARKDSPMTTFSVLEGVGRTLKGRDLRRVRNAVWRQTGFVD